MRIKIIIRSIDPSPVQWKTTDEKQIIFLFEETIQYNGRQCSDQPNLELASNHRTVDQEKVLHIWNGNFITLVISLSRNVLYLSFFFFFCFHFSLRIVVTDPFPYRYLKSCTSRFLHRCKLVPYCLQQVTFEKLNLISVFQCQPQDNMNSTEICSS